MSATTTRDPNEPGPTHRCRVCGAFWRFYLGGEGPNLAGSWNLRSPRALECCDNAPMGRQIRATTAADLAEWLTAP